MNESKNTISSPTQWVELYGNFLYSFAMLRVRSKSDAEDLVQETLLSAIESINSFKGNSSEKTWLTAILKNKIFDFYRKEKRTIPFSHLEKDTEEENNFLDKYFRDSNDNYPMHWKSERIPKDWESSPQEAIIQSEFQQIFQQCLEDLQVKHSRVFILREIDGYSTKEICKELDVSESNIWVILHRVRTSLRNCLEINWFEGKSKK